MPCRIDQRDIHLPDDRPPLHLAIEGRDAAAGGRDVESIVIEPRDNAVFDDDPGLVAGQPVTNLPDFCFAKRPV